MLAGAIIWWCARKLDWPQVKLSVQIAGWRLLALGAVVVLAGYLWRAIRWQAFLAPLTKASLREVWVATTVGFGAVLMIGRAAEIVRPVVLPMRDKRVRPAASFVTIMIERVYDTMTVVSIFALNLLWLKPATGSAENLSRTRAIGFLLVILLAAGIVVLICFKRRSQSVLVWLDSKIGERGRKSTRLNSSHSQI